MAESKQIFAPSAWFKKKIHQRLAAEAVSLINLALHSGHTLTPHPTILVGGECPHPATMQLYLNYVLRQMNVPFYTEVVSVYDDEDGSKLEITLVCLRCSECLKVKE